ncbi:hypothetical protein DXG01_017236 [Tephrocybe rancida]|nr:hypothetical protein DXG01_017236 [Tephrocybe rancida]
MQPSIPRQTSHSVDTWDLDAQFFASLSKWTLDNPNSSLDSIFRRIDEAINNGQDFLGLIPNAPFPAGSLVKSVAQLVQLGAKIGYSQHEVRNFAVEIIHWVGQVNESFTKAGNGRFTNITWSNLADMRSLVDEICGWAAARLEDGRWNFRNKKVEGEIADFRRRLDDTRQMFNARSSIVISGGLDAIFQLLRATFNRQDMFIVTLEKLKKSQDEIVADGRHQIAILQEQRRRKALEEELGSWTVSNATYSLQKKKPCSPDTRMEILDTIQTWLDDHSEGTSKNFLWLVGPPGCGKSAVMASVVRRCKSRHIAAAQFFINRNDPNTTNPIKYFPTVMREVAKQSDEVEQQLHDSLKGHSFSVDTPEEAANFFVDVVGKAAKNNPSIPILVIFDGLDETTRDCLEDTAATFSKLFSKLSDYPNAKILISSRPEDEILKSFRTPPPLEQHVLELVINIDDPDSRRDVRTYFQRRLTEIAKKHDLSPAVWPGDERLEKLVEHASGLFIWAVTAANYIHSLLWRHGKEVMDSALAQFDNKAMTDINILYLTICWRSRVIYSIDYRVMR